MSSDTHSCVICGEVGLSASEVQTHLFIHAEVSPSCPFCSLSSISLDELHYHIAVAHAETSAGKPSTLPPPASRENGARGGADGREADDALSSARQRPAPSQGPRKSRSPSGGQKATSSPDGADTTDGAMPVVAARATDSTRPRGEKYGSFLGRLGESQSERRRLDGGVSDRGSQEAEVEAPSPSRCRQKGVEDVRVECPFCGLKESGEQQILQHLQSVHADAMDTPQKAASRPSSQGGERNMGRVACPVCDTTLCSERELQLHVEQHFSGGEVGALEDELLAEALQNEEVVRRQEEDRRESEEFRRLQREHGMDGRGGFARQAQRSLQRDMERGAISPLELHERRAQLLQGLADGRDDGNTRTAGLTAALARVYGTGAAVRDVARVWLAADTSHYRGDGGDRGWGCGYRNLQMLMSSLARLDRFSFLGLQGGARMPGIPRLQALVEAAWEQGFDPQGASNFAGKLRGTRAWIGTTELYALLTSQRVRCRVVDFHRATGEGGTHPLLFAWVTDYFRGGGHERVPPPAQLVVSTRLPPLYLQHQGHSRTVVGLEERRDGTLWLLIFDPAHSAQTTDQLLRAATGNTAAAAAATAALRPFRRPVGALRHRQYQVLAAETTELTDAEREVSAYESHGHTHTHLPYRQEGTAS
ncbi:zinc finger-containing ubiquitin peptidase 1 isoform X1 [Lethenteron reissneri]|uniref:zinc finger-containing ubiquitin peptidase 1 isoform X1 n=1 Tax=Lethenteron reissneri TaxID=7753 RepID=UPI002AB73138|nr:zinc finger-containing ubiquitin peptidase 1 isoform X1 [Lethenteron reissneri]XP_061430906.1 zinc finger-containing ubiquitin peptidase 1 isoform X1 [Lethenteron reissneri]XP_061430907.1 zinc finger-containing ubiquitin peptidase 1 isoform X1 [Lethenteron reissneri]